MCKANCLIFIVMMFIAATSSGQTCRPSRSTPQTLSNRSPEQRQYKGIRELVNYAQDLALTDVFFVNTDVGYVSGASRPRLGRWAETLSVCTWADFSPPQAKTRSSPSGRGESLNIVALGEGDD